MKLGFSLFLVLVVVLITMTLAAPRPPKPVIPCVTDYECWSFQTHCGFDQFAVCAPTVVNGTMKDICFCMNGNP